MTATAASSRWTPADELLKARREASLEQEDLAVALGVSAKTISRWEHGRGEPTISQWRLIASVTRASWLLAGGSGDIVTYWGALEVVGDGQPHLPMELPPSILPAQLAVVH